MEHTLVLQKRRLKAAIVELLGERERVTVAIDGRCASGKTTLAKALGAELGGNLFHMDDFFLPTALRTAERLSQPGGNVHYERFAEEVLAGLSGNEPFEYGVFDCSAMDITRRVRVESRRLNIIEGSYSMHPYFGAAYDLTVFMSVSPEVQEQRIRRRGGDGAWSAFRDRWIPLEESYFASCRVRERADLLLEERENCEE